MSFLLNAPRAGLQTELNAFFDHALAENAARTVSKSAFCQARRDLNPDALRSLLSCSARLIAEHHPAAQWHQRRVVAIDSTTLRVPNVPECAQHFGGMRTSCGKYRPLARASALLDVARGCFVDAVIGGLASDDRTLAARHLDALSPHDLLVMDRGYPSRDWFNALNTRGISFCARISTARWRAVTNFARGNLDDAIVDLGTPDTTLPLRLVRHVSPNGAELVMATNVLDASIIAADFADLYHSRWRIEEAFKILKARLQVENWSGRLPHTVLQDFFAALVRVNCAAALTLDLQQEAPCALATTPLKANGWRSKLNATLILKALRHYLPRLLLNIDVAITTQKLIARLRAPGSFEHTRPDRKAPRPKGVRIAGFHPAYKAA